MPLGETTVKYNKALAIMMINTGLTCSISDANDIEGGGGGDDGGGDDGGGGGSGVFSCCSRFVLLYLPCTCLTSTSFSPAFSFPSFASLPFADFGRSSVQRPTDWFCVCRCNPREASCGKR